MLISAITCFIAEKELESWVHIQLVRMVKTFLLVFIGSYWPNFLKVTTVSPIEYIRKCEPEKNCSFLTPDMASKNDAKYGIE